MGYQTRQSKRILEELQKNKSRHLTAEEIYLRLKESGEGVGQATVYRRMEKLCEEGTVRQYHSGNGSSACFQFVEQGAQCHTHYHLKCTACGKLIHAECTFLNALSNHIQAAHGFSIDGSKTVFYGLCAACAEKENPQR